MAAAVIISYFITTHITENDEIKQQNKFTFLYNKNIQVK